MKKAICLLFLLLTACTAIAPTPTTTPTAVLPTASPTIEPSPTPDIIAQALVELQKVGINASKNDSVWTLSIDGVEIPDILLDENGFTVQTNVKKINIPFSEIGSRVEQIDGILVIKDATGKKLATWNPANPEAGWVEMKQYEQCPNPEDWKKCYIPIEDLGIGGAYYNWLNESWNPDIAPMDPDKVAILRSPIGNTYVEGVGGGEIAKADVPFATGFSYGNTKCGVTWDGLSHEMTCAVVPIAISIPGKPGETRKLIGLNVQSYNRSDAQMANLLKDLQKNGKLMLAGFTIDPETNLVIVDGSASDAIDFLQETIGNYPDVYDRFGKFAETLDPSFISGPGFVIAIFSVH